MVELGERAREIEGHIEGGALYCSASTLYSSKYMTIKIGNQYLLCVNVTCFRIIIELYSQHIHSHIQLITFTYTM